MANDIILYSISDLQIMASSIANSGLCGITKPDQAFTLLLISQAEGKHPALAVRDYDIIFGKPAKKTEAMLRDFQAAGGNVEWHSLSDAEASATFSHSQGGSVKIDWNIPRAQKAGIAGKDNWKKFPRQMLRSRCVSEGIKSVFPGATSGMYAPEEISDMKEVVPQNKIIEAMGNAETIDSLCERLAADIAISQDLAATYEAHAATFTRMEAERPEWVAAMHELFSERDKELKNTA